MVKKVRTTAYRTQLSQWQGLRLPVLCVFFAFGAVLGHVAAQLYGGDGDLATYLQGIAAVEAQTSVSLLSVLTAYFRYPLMALLLGYCSFGTMAIPVLLAAQGFSFSFSAATLAASLGRQSVLLALASFGLRSMVTVFCTLLLALWAMEKVTGSGDSKKCSRNVVALCFLVLALGVILELTVVPKLFYLALASLK